MGVSKYPSCEGPLLLILQFMTRRLQREFLWSSCRDYEPHQGGRLHLGIHPGCGETLLHKSLVFFNVLLGVPRMLFTGPFLRVMFAASNLEG